MMHHIDLGNCRLDHTTFSWKLSLFLDARTASRSHVALISEDVLNQRTKLRRRGEAAIMHTCIVERKLLETHFGPIVLSVGLFWRSRVQHLGPVKTSSLNRFLEESISLVKKKFWAIKAASWQKQFHLLKYVRLKIQTKNKKKGTKHTLCQNIINCLRSIFKKVYINHEITLLAFFHSFMLEHQG